VPTQLWTARRRGPSRRRRRRTSSPRRSRCLRCAGGDLVFGVYAVL
jgi:hypothetical protein